LAVTFLLPLAIPGEGIDYEFFFITVLVLLAWFGFRWEMVKSITQRGGKAEVLLGVAVVLADYTFNAFRGSSVGIIDLLVIFLGTIIAFYGIGSLKRFWVPATYGIFLLFGYQLEALTPNYVVLQNWLAGVMASILNAVGISSSVSGDVVSMSTSGSIPMLLDVGGPCTGVQGIIAFGMLSTMALLDLKPKISRILPIFAIGFAGAFLVNILRLLLMFLAFKFTSLEVANILHIYLGYFVFVVWVVAFWTFAFRYLAPKRDGLAQSTKH
jgi:exosortase/archaeosortase family protein